MSAITHFFLSDVEVLIFQKMLISPELQSVPPLVSGQDLNLDKAKDLLKKKESSVSANLGRTNGTRPLTWNIMNGSHSSSQ